jgi:hypothetical protein
MPFFLLEQHCPCCNKKANATYSCKIDNTPESFGMFRPMDEIPLIFRFYPEMQPIQPVKALILGSHWVISISFHLEMLAVYQVAALLLLFKRQMEKLS